MPADGRKKGAAAAAAGAGCPDVPMKDWTGRESRAFLLWVASQLKRQKPRANMRKVAELALQNEMDASDWERCSTVESLRDFFNTELDTAPDPPMSVLSAQDIFRHLPTAAASGGAGGGAGGAAASGGSGGGDAGHKWVQTSEGQLPASSFVSSKNKPLQGAGMFFSVPAYVTDADDQALRDLGIDLPAHDDHAVQQLCGQLQPLVMGSRSLGHFHETRGSTSMSTSRVVQQSHLDQLCAIMNNTTLTRMPLWQTTSASRDITMESLDCPFGVVSRSSEPDGYILQAIDGAEKPVVGGIVEAKSTAYAPIEALRQGFSESTNVALTQRRLGLECTEVRIPVWATTGQQMQLGVTRMLQPAFAYLTVVSKALDLNDPTDRLLAARLLIATRKLCARPLVCNPADRFAGMELFLSLDAYHRKDLENVFTTCGSDADITLSHMQRQLSKLVGTPAAACAVAPITMYYNKRKEWLVFPNLTPAGFVIGMPEDDNVGTYLAAVRAAVQAIHDAGVVHLDLYPSNIMWRKIEGVGEHADHPQVEVKIIDWDTAHAKDGPLAADVRERLLTLPLRRRLVERERGNPQFACGEWDTTLIAVLRWAASAREWREALQTTDKKTLDRKFWECIAAYNKSLHTDGGSSEQVGQ